MFKDEVTESQDMASLSRKSHRIKKIKKFKVLIKLPSFVMGHIYIPLPWSHGFVNQIWIVACILCNFFTTTYSKFTTKLPLIQNSAAVNSVWKFNKNVILYFQLFVISTYWWLILYTLSFKSLLAVNIVCTQNSKSLFAVSTVCAQNYHIYRK